MSFKYATFFLLFNLLLMCTHQKPTYEKAPRCGQPADAPHILAAHLAENKWKKSHLTYRIFDWCAPFTESQLRKAFEKAIMVWTDKVNLTIKESTSLRSDIKVYFTKHDGRNNTLGYYNSKNDNICFDIDEDWTLSPTPVKPKIGFVWVVTHELGHALGLPHSDNIESIMYPYYIDNVTKPSHSDLKKLKLLYGRAILNNSDLCGGASVDAILDSENPILIRRKQYWTISRDSLKNGPFFLDLLFPGLPGKVDAAFAVRNITYFLSKNIFYKFKHKSKTPSKNIIAAGLPVNIDASFYDPTSANIYFFKGSKYYALNTKKPVGKRMVVKGKSISKDWDGVPGDIEAAALLKNSRVLFIKRSKCYVVNLNSKHTISTDNCSTFYKC